MTYEEILALVTEDFELLREAPHCHIVLTGLTYDGCRGFCVAIYNKGDSVVVTDLGETKEVFDEVEREEWEALCETHGFQFSHWHIERVFHGMQDLYDFIQFIDFISDKYFQIED